MNQIALGLFAMISVVSFSKNNKQTSDRYKWTKPLKINDSLNGYLDSEEPASEAANQRARDILDQINEDSEGYSIFNGGNDVNGDLYICMGKYNGNYQVGFLGGLGGAASDKNFKPSPYCKVAVYTADPDQRVQNIEDGFIDQNEVRVLLIKDGKSPKWKSASRLLKNRLKPVRIKKVFRKQRKNLEKNYGEREKDWQYNATQNLEAVTAKLPTLKTKGLWSATQSLIDNGEISEKDLPAQQGQLFVCQSDTYEQKTQTSQPGESNGLVPYRMEMVKGSDDTAVLIDRFDLFWAYMTYRKVLESGIEEAKNGKDKRLAKRRAIEAAQTGISEQEYSLCIRGSQNFPGENSRASLKRLRFLVD